MTAPERLQQALSDRYRIERELGAGGMATVYLAEDLKHHRKVAIKVLRPELAAVIGAERFLAEIRTTANLQHPHILALIDSGETDGMLWYVMPYVEGESLRDRITREKQLPVADAVRIATEVAGALDYAHRHNVIHRDIKPENILLHDGSALVADFGIALAASSGAGTRMTETGMSLGTPHYMSPEQAMGEREITARSDVYALGCITYEMLVGEPPFNGPTAQAIIARVMTEEPRALTLQRKTIPPGVEAAVFTALEKLPADRFGSTADFAAALANPNTTTARTSVQPVVVARRRGWLVTAALAALTLIAGYFIGGRNGAASGGGGDVVRATVTLGDSTVVRTISNIRMAIAPSGERLVFVGAEGDRENALYLRELNQPTERKLPDTDGAIAPFFSPDGQSVGFFVATSGKAVMKVLDIGGGAARTLVPDSLPGFGGASWGDDGQIYFTQGDRGLARISSAGGAVTHISRIDTVAGVTEQDFPDVLPGSRHAIVMLWKGSASANHIGVVDLQTGAVRDLTPGTYARYVAPGYLAIGTADGQILVAPFDPKTATLKGAPALQVQNVQSETSNGTVQFAVSATGTLVYEQSGGARAGLLWVSRDGQRTVIDSTQSGILASLALSPDGSQIAFARADGGDNQIWLRHLATGAIGRLSFDVTGADRPVWTLDGRDVAYLGTRDGRRTAWIRRADGSDQPRPASPGNTRLDEIAFDPTGRYIVLRSEGSGVNTRTLLVVEKGVDTIPRTLVSTQFDNYAAALSPNGQWLAYTSVEDGKEEVYVRPFPKVDSTRFMISVGGGSEPVWRRDGTELFFRGSRGEMFTAPVNTGKVFTHASPMLLFDGTGLAVQQYYRSYDVAPDGKRFLMVTSGGEDLPRLEVILNWQAELAKIKETSQ